MLINPKKAIDNGWIKFPDWMSDEQKEKCIQPNAIDFTLDVVHTMDDETSFCLSESFKRMKDSTTLETFKDYEGEEFWSLKPHTIYDGTSDFYIKVPDGAAAMLIVRSTLSRNGLFVTSGLWDSGYQGHIGAAIHNRANTKANIAPHTRIGQVMFVESENAGTYGGGYNHVIDTHWTEGIKK